MIEALGYLALTVVFIGAIILYISKSDIKESYYKRKFIELKQKSSSFQNKYDKYRGTDIPPSQYPKAVEEALKDPKIIQEIRDHDERERKHKVLETQRNLFIYTSIDELLQIFGDEVLLTKEEFYNRLGKLYPNEYTIQKRVQEFDDNYCFGLTMNNIRQNSFKLNIHNITHPYRTTDDGNPIIISFKDYKDPKKREEFRGKG